MAKTENVKERKPKTKFVATTYQKKFETFTEMINEFKTMHPEFKNIFKYDEENVYPKDAVYDVITYFQDNAPDIMERTNLPMAISASSNKVSLKTNKFFSFRWQFKYDKNGFVTDIYANVTVFTKENNTNKSINDLAAYLSDENNGWEEFEYTK